MSRSQGPTLLGRLLSARRGRLGDRHDTEHREGPAVTAPRAPMQRLCRITVPGLSITRDFTAARRRLLARFPDIDEVVATTAPGTLLVASSRPEDVDAWLDVLLRGEMSSRSRAVAGGPRRDSGDRDRRAFPRHPGEDPPSRPAWGA
jgi:hypothetical protein